MSCQTSDAGKESCLMILRCVVGHMNIEIIYRIYLNFFSVAEASDQQHIITLVLVLFLLINFMHSAVSRPFHCEEQYILPIMY